VEHRRGGQCGAGQECLTPVTVERSSEESKSRLGIHISRGVYVLLSAIILTAGAFGLGRQYAIQWQKGILADQTGAVDSISNSEIAEILVYLALALVGATGMVVMAVKIDKKSSPPLPPNRRD